MIEKPNITDERIISALQENFSIRVRSIEFLPLGLDAASWSYRVDADAERGVYFLKVRKGLPNPAGILIPRFLKEQGIEQVMTPLLSARREAWEKVDDFYFILYPFVRGEQVMDVGMSDDHWVEFGAVMKQLHTTKLTPDLARQIRRETFTSHRLEWDQELHAQVMLRGYNDPFQKELAEFWRENHATIGIILERSEALARRMQAAAPEFVLCHADIHTANVLRTEDDKIFIMDWDETMLAPKERDLMFVMESIFGDRLGGRAERLFFEGYGETEIDPLALAYYRYNWCVEDMGGFAEQIFTTENVGEETKKSSIWWFKSLFSQGNSIESALHTDIDF
jgi:spectinomycin phosphotransferase